MTFSEFLKEQGFERGKKVSIKGLFDAVFKTNVVKVEHYKFTDEERLWLLLRAFQSMEYKQRVQQITIRTYERKERLKKESETPLFSDYKPLSKQDIMNHKVDMEQ